MYLIIGLKIFILNYKEEYQKSIIFYYICMPKENFEVKCVLEANKDNILDTFEKNDIGRNEDVFSFVRYLQKVTGPYSVAIDGSWGSGKTFFVKQTKMILDALNPYTQFENEYSKDELYRVECSWEKFDQGKTKKTNQLCVYFDAWQYDFDEEPVLSLIYQISKNVTSAYKFQSERNYLDIATNFLDLFTSYSSNNLLRSFAKSNPTDRTSSYKDLQETINDYFNELLPEHGERLVVFIDELDRCNPRYAVRLLERIKHYFTNDKITFVFSVNLDQLQHTVKQYYGQDFNGYGYLDRFFDLILPMPKLDVKKFYKSIDFGFKSTTPFIIADAMIEKYEMSMRMILHYNEEIKERDFDINPLFDQETKFFISLIVLPVIIGLKLANHTAYTNFIQGKDGSVLTDVILSNKLILDRIYRNWFGGVEAEQNNIVNQMKEWTKQVYEALFSGGNDMLIGNIRVNETTREYARNIISELPKNH